jgi:hypothetical protein
MLNQGIEFSGKGWDLFERSVRLKVHGQEVVISRAPEEPWKELHWIGKVATVELSSYHPVTLLSLC